MRKLLTAVLTMMVLAAAAANTTAAEEKFYWENHLSHPFTGTIGSALKAMTRYGLPESAIPQLRDRGEIPGNIYNGEECLAMIYGDDQAAGGAKVLENVIVSWTDYFVRPTRDRFTEGLVVRNMVDGNNWLLCRQKSWAETPPSAAVPQVGPSRPGPTTAIPAPPPALKPTQAAPPGAASPQVATPPAALPPSVQTVPPATVSRGSNLVVAVFRDRDRFFRDRYLGERGKEDRRTPYYRSVLAFGHANLKQELRARPLSQMQFLVTVRGGEGQALATKTVATDQRGEVFLPLPPPEQIRLVEVEVVGTRKDVIPPERTLYVRPDELARFNPLYVWFIQTQGLD